LVETFAKNKKVFTKKKKKNNSKLFVFTPGTKGKANAAFPAGTINVIANHNILELNKQKIKTIFQKCFHTNLPYFKIKIMKILYNKLNAI